MRGAVRSKGRWTGRRVPTQDPSTDHLCYLAGNPDNDGSNRLHLFGFASDKNCTMVFNATARRPRLLHLHLRRARLARLGRSTPRAAPA